jgi:hypothetical protein
VGGQAEFPQEPSANCQPLTAKRFQSALALLVPRVRADDIDDAASPHDLAVLADLFD